MLMYLKDNTKDLVEHNEENNIISPSESLRNTAKHRYAHTHVYPMYLNVRTWRRIH